MNKSCISCGAPVPEGRLACSNCKNALKFQPDAILKDGTPVYLKTQPNPTGVSTQLYLYDLLNRRSK